MRARPSLSTGTATSCRAGRRRLPYESQPWWTTSARPLRFRAVHKSCETVESSRAYPLFGYLSVEVRHPNVLPGPVRAPAARLAGSHMNPELAASHPPCLPPSSNLVRVIQVLEHVVDTVLSFEAERHHAHRIVRAVKNRFGAVSELGVFEMTGAGLRPVPNPSKLFLSERSSGAPGSVVLCCIEESRPILVEVQALVSTSTYGNARRMAIGIDQNRVTLLLAVLEKRAGLNLGGDDVYVNIAGGMSIEEPAADLSVVAAVASSVRNRSLPASTAMFGEIGLSGEIRGIPQAALRVREAARMGFVRVVLPAANVESLQNAGCDLVGVRTVGEALDQLIT